jgi:hypothetical protein
MHLVEGRKQATSVFYRVSDANVFTLLDVAREMFDKRLTDLKSMVEEEPESPHEGVTLAGSPS